MKKEHLKEAFLDDLFGEIDSKKGKKTGIGIGAEEDGISVDISYVIPQPVFDEILDKMRSAGVDIDEMDDDTISRRVVRSIVDKYLDVDNITPEDVMDSEAEEPVLTMENFIKYKYHNQLPLQKGSDVAMIGKSSGMEKMPGGRNSGNGLTSDSNADDSWTRDYFKNKLKLTPHQVQKLKDWEEKGEVKLGDALRVGKNSGMEKYQPHKLKRAAHLDELK